MSSTKIFCRAIKIKRVTTYYYCVMCLHVCTHNYIYTHDVACVDVVSVSPQYSRYSHCSGEIEDYTDGDYRQGRQQHVYIYFKSLYVRQPSANTARQQFTEIT